MVSAPPQERYSGRQRLWLKRSATDPFALELAHRMFYDCHAVKAVPLILQALGHIAFILMRDGRFK
jgi:hypothetical protein